MASLRDTWKQAKAKVAKDLDVTKVAAEKLNFGPLLDKYEAELKAYDVLTTKLQKNPDDAKEKAAKKKVKDAATAAYIASGKYTACLKSIQDGSTGATKKAAGDLLSDLAMKIIVVLKQYSEGNF